MCDLVPRAGKQRGSKVATYPLLHREVEQHFKYLQVTFCGPGLSSQRDVWHRCFVKHVFANS